MISKGNIVFVGGIHGVGKSTLCKRISSNLNLGYLLASKLISDYKDKITENHLDCDKFVANLNENQDILIQAVNEMAQPSQKYIMDGHFTLLDSMNTVQTIPLSTYAAIGPIALIVLVDDPPVIQERLRSRDHKDYDLDLLETMQNQEIKHAEYVGCELKIAAYNISNANYSKVKQIIMDSFESRERGSLT